jgi:pilus assembly protein Flp/PilA
MAVAYLNGVPSRVSHTKSHGGTKMNNLFLKLYIKIQDLLSQEEGQDLVEYALIVALIALAATAGMKTLATAINNGFTSLGTTLNNAV